MIPILLGKTFSSGHPIRLEPDVFRTHFHLIGATGTGKTVAIQTLLRPIMMQTGSEKSCLFVIDPMGNLATDLLRFIAHPTFCPQHVRDRLVYIEPAMDNVVMPFNPLHHSSESERYYQVMRAVDLVLRAWAAQDVSQQPRLLQWTYKTFCAAAMMGLPIAMCRYLLHPGTDEHDAILRRIPGDIRFHWQEILRARGGEATRILESTRNRLDPFFESPNLRYMFGSSQSRFDCDRFIRERRIVILNLAKLGRIPGFIVDTIGALALNEVFETASRLSTTEGRGVVDPTYILMDEFQKFVSVDIEDALPTVRQMGLRLILAHQSFSQLEREDVDLTQMIWQARSRLIFANNAKDADIVADELARLTFNKMKIKHQSTSKRQLIIGYRKEWLENVSETKSTSAGRTDQESRSSNRSGSRSHHTEATGYGRTSGEGTSDGSSHGSSFAESSGTSHGRSQVNVPIHETINEPSTPIFESFDEHALDWGRDVRRLKTGQAFAQFANSPEVLRILIDHFPLDDWPSLPQRVEELLARNFESDFFISSHTAAAEIERYRRELLCGPTIQFPAQLNGPSSDPKDAGSSDSEGGDNIPPAFEL